MWSIAKSQLSIFISTLVVVLSSCNPKDNIDKHVNQSSIDMVQSIVHAYDSIFNFSGVVLIGKGDSIIYQSAHGNANYEAKITNELHTQFRLASLSKQFTAAALLLLEQNGKVKLDEPVSTYLPQLKPEIAENITIHHLLSHSSGLARDIETLSTKELGKTYISVDSIISLINTSDLLYHPGEKWSYSNLGYNLAAKVIESVTGKSYGIAMDSLLFKPLGMTNTAHESSKNYTPKLAYGYVESPDSIMRAAYEDKSYVVGAGSIYASAYDLFIWSRAILNKKILNQKSLDKLFSRQSGRYGYGWFVDNYVWPPVNDVNHAKNMHHDGGSPGFESKLSILTKHDIVVIVLSNKLPSNLSGIANRITNTCVGFEESLPKRDGSDEFFQILFTQGVDSASALVNYWKTLNKEFLIPDNNNVFLIGRGYMDAKQYEKALLIMDYLNIESPKWSYPYLFKAFIYEELNDKEKAIEYYEKTIAKDSNQSNAILNLARLKNLENP